MVNINRREMLRASGLAVVGGTVSAYAGKAKGAIEHDPVKSVVEIPGGKGILKNIIIIKVDQLRWDFLGCMGHKVVKTPNIDKFAKDGYVLDNEFTVSTLCVPSRTSFFTGKYVHRTAKTSNAPEEHMQLKDWSFIEPLYEMGYTVGHAGKNHTFSNEYFEKYFSYREESTHHGKKVGTITDDDKKVKAYLRKDPRDGYENATMMLGGLIPGPMPFAAEKCPTYRIAEDGIKFVEDNKDKPFVLHYAFGDPHWPTVVPDPYYSMYDPEDMELEAFPIEWKGRPFKHFTQSKALGFDKYSVKELKRILATYCGQISYVDAAVGMMIDKLKELGLYEDSVIMFTADHGDYGGRYGIIEKTGSFHEVLVRIPGIIKLPGMKGDKHIEAQISNIDVLPTIFDYLGFVYPLDVQGESFLGVLKGEKEEHRETIFSEVGQANMPPAPIAYENYDAYNAERSKKNPFWFCEYTTRGRMVMIRKKDWKYMYYTGDTNELYDLKNDPLEMHNLVDDPKYAKKKAELKNELIEWLLKEPVLGV